MAHREFQMRAESPHGADPGDSNEVAGLNVAPVQLPRPRAQVLVALVRIDHPTLDMMIDRYARRVLDACGGNKTAAAQVLGIDRRSLYRLLAREVRS